MNNYLDEVKRTIDAAQRVINLDVNKIKSIRQELKNVKGRVDEQQKDIMTIIGIVDENTINLNDPERKKFFLLKESIEANNKLIKSYLVNILRGD